MVQHEKEKSDNDGDPVGTQNLDESIKLILQAEESLKEEDKTENQKIGEFLFIFIYVVVQVTTNFRLQYSFVQSFYLKRSVFITLFLFDAFNLKFQCCYITLELFTF